MRFKKTVETDFTVKVYLKKRGKKVHEERITKSNKNCAQFQFYMEITRMYTVVNTCQPINH